MKENSSQSVFKPAWPDTKTKQKYQKKRIQYIHVHHEYKSNNPKQNVINKMLILFIIYLLRFYL